MHAGYTPLHMAVGYSHVAIVAELLDAGANPEMQDRQSRDVIALVESIRKKMPISPEWMGKRMALEQVIALLGSECTEQAFFDSMILYCSKMCQCLNRSCTASTSANA